MKSRRGPLAEWERLSRVARLLKIEPRTLRNWVRRGLVPSRQAEARATIHVHAPSARQVAEAIPCLSCPFREKRGKLSAFSAI
jgi:transposase-like protein